MGRPTGARNADYDERRRALAAKALTRLVADDGPRASFAELAHAAGVSVPTLKHYFGDRTALVGAALDVGGAQGRGYVDALRVPSHDDLATSLLDVAVPLVEAWTRFGVGRVISSALAHGVHDETAGRATVDAILEPLVQALEARLRVHAADGALDAATDDELRAAALAFLSPLVVALLHQRELSGRACRPLDVAAFARTHVARFVRGWGVAPGRAS